MLQINHLNALEVSDAVTIVEYFNYSKYYRQFDFFLIKNTKILKIIFLLLSYLKPVMKKFCFIFSFVVISISCSNDSSNVTAVDPNLLQRVDFYPGTSFEKRYIFNADGLLTEITKADGTLIEKFVYDADNNVTQNTKYENGLATENYLITYDSNNKITDINSNHYNYSTSDNRYYYTIGFDDYSCNLNSEFLVTESHLVYDDTADVYNTDYYCGYALGNMTSYSNSSWTADIYTNYEFDNRINPLKNALLPIFRFKSLIDTNFFYSSLSSVNNITSQAYYSIDPESHTYDYIYNSISLPQTQTRNDYSNGVFEGSLVSANYYYQGDVLP